MRIRTKPLSEITVSRLGRLKDVVDLNPPYQREGGIWKPENRGTLIDSIINGLDMPKLYFEAVTRRRSSPSGHSYQYAVLDGKQRLEAILAFASDDLRLNSNFIFFEDESVEAGGMNLSELSSYYPLLAQRFLDYEIPITRVITDSGDLIEEMFQRLNAASSLNAAELRNSKSGPTKDSTNALAEHEILASRSPIKNARYKHRELAAKFLAIEHQLDTKGKISDTKARTLLQLFVATQGDKAVISREQMSQYQERATCALDRMLGVFDDSDRLLASIGTVVVYYIAFRDKDFSETVDRSKLVEFEEARRDAMRMPEDTEDYDRPANHKLREYNVYVQSSNDGTALTRRARLLSAFVEGYNENDSLAGLDQSLDVDSVDADEVEDGDDEAPDEA